jgi:hypothetical protein
MLGGANLSQADALCYSGVNSTGGINRTSVEEYDGVRRKG